MINALAILYVTKRAIPLSKKKLKSLKPLTSFTSYSLSIAYDVIKILKIILTNRR